MSLHAYGKRGVRADYLRGGIGFAVTAFPVAFTPMLGTFQVVFGLIALVFAGFVLKTWLRAQTRIELMPEGIRAHGPLARKIVWAELARLDLRYYSTRKDKGEGWMQLVLRSGDGTKLAVESTLDGFDTVLEHAAAAAGRNDLALDVTTTDNLAAAGVSAGAVVRDGQDAAGQDTAGTGGNETWTRS